MNFGSRQVALSSLQQPALAHTSPKISLNSETSRCLYSTDYSTDKVHRDMRHETQLASTSTSSLLTVDASILQYVTF